MIFSFLSFTLLSDLIEHFDGASWAMNGPDVMTRVLKKLCKVESSQITEKCENFNLLPREKCYAIGWKEWKKFFKDESAEEVKRRTQNSSYIHLWNKYSSNYRLKIDSGAAFVKLAEAFCPRVYYSREKFIWCATMYDKRSNLFKYQTLKISMNKFRFLHNENCYRNKKKLLLHVMKNR